MGWPHVGYNSVCPGRTLCSLWTRIGHTENFFLACVSPCAASTWFPRKHRPLCSRTGCTWPLYRYCAPRPNVDPLHKVFRFCMGTECKWSRQHGVLSCALSVWILHFVSFRLFGTHKASRQIFERVGLVLGVWLFCVWPCCLWWCRCSHTVYKSLSSF